MLFISNLEGSGEMAYLLGDMNVCCVQIQALDPPKSTFPGQIGHDRPTIPGPI